MVSQIEPTTAAPAISSVARGKRTATRVSHAKGRDINEESACGIRSEGIMSFLGTKQVSSLSCGVRPTIPRGDVPVTYTGAARASGYSNGIPALGKGQFQPGQTVQMPSA